MTAFSIELVLYAIGTVFVIFMGGAICGSTNIPDVAALIRATLARDVSHNCDLVLCVTC